MGFCINYIFSLLIAFIFLTIIYTILSIIKFNDSKCVDGHILRKKHYCSINKGCTNMANAISDDNKYKPKYQKVGSLFEKYFTYKDIPVKIIVKNNKVINFFIENFSYMNKENKDKKHFLDY